MKDFLCLALTDRSRSRFLHVSLWITFPNFQLFF